jgi:hypothetical protein
MPARVPQTNCALTTLRACYRRPCKWVARTTSAYMQQVGMLEEKLGAQPESFSIASEARIIGTVTDTHVGRVTLRTSLGTDRIVGMLSGDQLPRIC